MVSRTIAAKPDLHVAATIKKIIKLGEDGAQQVWGDDPSFKDAIGPKGRVSTLGYAATCCDPRLFDDPDRSLRFPATGHDLGLDTMSVLMELHGVGLIKSHSRCAWMQHQAENTDDLGLLRHGPDVAYKHFAQTLAREIRTGARSEHVPVLDRPSTGVLWVDDVGGFHPPAFSGRIKLVPGHILTHVVLREYGMAKRSNVYAGFIGQHFREAGLVPLVIVIGRSKTVVSKLFRQLRRQRSLELANFSYILAPG